MKRENVIEGLIGLLAILSIVIIVVESLVALPPGWLFTLYGVDLAICLVFAVEFVYRLRQSENRTSFLKTHGFEILAMTPAFAFYAAGTPLISGGLRSLRLIRVIRMVLVITRMARFFAATSRFAQQSRLVYLLAAAISTIFIGGFAAFLLEHGVPDAKITNLSDALWWSIATVTTVGYGDIVPNTHTGRIMGMVLMVIGIGIMTAFIATVSATLVESRMKRSEDRGSLRDVMLSEIKDKIDHIDKLSDSELDLLMKMILALRSTKVS